MEQKKKIGIFLIGIISVLAIVAGAVFVKREDSEIQRREQIFKGDKSKVIEQDDERKETYIIGASQLPTVSNSYLQNMEGAAIMNELVYPGLAEYGAGKYKHLLAKKILFEDNGKTAVVTLRSDVSFSDGCNITADDIIYTYHYLASPDVAYDEQVKLWCIEGAEVYCYGQADKITGIEKVSEKEVRFTFEEESLNNLAIFTIPVLHPTSHEYETVNLETENVGTGAYKINSFIPYEEAVLDRNEYAADKGTYKKIKIVISDLSKLEGQLIDTMIIPKSSIDEIEKLGAYDIYCAYAKDRDFILFDLNDEVMSNVENRQKFTEALNREQIFDAGIEKGRFSYGLIAGNKEMPNFESLIKETYSAKELDVVLPEAYSGTEKSIFDEIKKQLNGAGANVKIDGDASVSYYYGQLDDIITGFEIPEFYEKLNGKTLSKAGDLLEKCLVECYYVIPLHNEGYYTINLCNKREIGILENRY